VEKSSGMKTDHRENIVFCKGGLLFHGFCTGGKGRNLTTVELRRARRKEEDWQGFRPKFVQSIASVGAYSSV